MIGIYKITNPNNKIYIGQTINIEQRWSKYYHLNCKSQIRLYNSLKKYGHKNHKFEVIEECLIEQLNQKEKFYKQQFINQIGWGMVLFCSLNDGKGGHKSEETKQKMRKPKPVGFGIGRKHSKETKRKMSVKRYTEEQKQRMRKPRLTFKKGKENGNFGKTKSQKHIGKINKPILQYDIQGNFIKKWESIKSANISLGKKYNTSSISLCLVGKYKKAFGFIWKYKDSNRILKKTKTNFNPILQLTLDGNIINEFLNPTIAQNKTGVNSGAIWFCLKGKTKISGGFKWKYK